MTKDFDVIAENPIDVEEAGEGNKRKHSRSNPLFVLIACMRTFMFD